jgi:hypothetical protein
MLYFRKTTVQRTVVLETSSVVNLEKKRSSVEFLNQQRTAILTMPWFPKIPGLLTPNTT